MRLTSRWVGPAVAAAALCALVIPSLAMGAPKGDPRGDNGTVKIDGIPFDSYPDNEPHVGCTFEVDFYGFDLGNFNATVRFWAQPPSGKDVFLLTDTVPIGEDAAGGGTDLDAEREYNLGTRLKILFAHPNQGYHIKLKVNAPGSIGNDTKYKTFWVTGCAGY